MATDPTKMLSMSDEDIMAMSSPPEDEPAVAVVPAVVVPDLTGSTAGEVVVIPDGEKEATPTNPLPGDKDDGELEPQLVPVPGSEPAPDPIKGKEGEAATKEGDPKAGDTKTEAKPGDAPVGDKPAVVEPKPGETMVVPKGAEQTPEALATFYDQMMTPFKANGKMIELRSPEEAIGLMKMGANYTKKLQELQPQRKLLMMLENNGLLDEGKLSFLIDIEKKDPEAIKKLLKDTGIDPLEIDTSTEPAYVAGNHQVGDDEAKFRTTLDELSSTSVGAETLTQINTTWDQASKEALWTSPEIMTIINEQREAGVYDVIKAEVDRQTTLGQIPPNTPFLQAYKTVGDAMAKASIGDKPGGKAPEAIEPGQAEPLVLATRVATPKSVVANGDKVASAAATRSTPAAKAPMVNPLAESDEAFMKRMENRL